MTHRDFDADRRAARGAPVTFTLAGETFEAISDCPAGLMLDQAALASKPVPEQVEATMAFLDAVLAGDSPQRFAAKMRASDDPITVEDLAGVIEWLTEVYSGRPPEPPQRSSTAPSPPGLSSTAVAPSPALTL